MSTYPNTLSPIKLGPISLRHRVVMSGHGMGLGYGKVGISEEFEAYLLARARGGASMIGSESAPVHESSVSRSLGIRLYSDEVLPSLRSVAEKAREAGSRLAITLWHGGHKDSAARLPFALAPSPIPNGSGEVPKTISGKEIADITRAYGEAARRCAEAGLDAVELQTSTDYLLGSFLSPVLNRRTDAYGGSFENRLRFIREILELIRESAGSSMAVGIRTSEGHHIPGAEIDYDLETSVACMKALADAGLVDYVSVMTGSTWAPSGSSIPHMSYPKNQLLEQGKAFKSALSVPVILAGRIKTPEDAETVLSQGAADVIAMARGWIADPEFMKKVEAGEAHRIRPCMSCNQGCAGMVFRGIPGSCVINPAAGRELELPEPVQADARKTVAVIGAGPAGLEAARVAAERGHSVVIHERSVRLGGDMAVAASAPHRNEITPALDWWGHELDRLNVQINFSSEVAVGASAADLGVDQVIWAIGGQPGATAVWARRPHLAEGIPGTSLLPHGRDILAGKTDVTGNVLIIAEEGGWPSASVVEHLMQQSDVSAITVVTPELKFGLSELSRTWELAALTKRLRDPQVEILTECTVTHVSNGLADLSDGSQVGPFDSIVLCTGVVAPEMPEDALAVGDCVAPRGWWSATTDAGRLARSI